MTPLASIGTILVLVAASTTLACGNADSGRLPNAPTETAQQALVKGLPIASKRTLFRRHIVDSAAPFKVQYPPYDHSGTAAAAAWQAQKAIIANNTKDSGWEKETPYGRIRVVFVDENNDEWEEEYETGELQELQSQGEARGVNTATYDVGQNGDAGVSAPGQQPQGWSNGTDARVPEPINATYPADHNILRRLGQLDDNCTATLLGRRIVVTALHCVIDGTGAVSNGRVYRPRRNGVTEPWGSAANNGTFYDSDYFNNDCNVTYTAATREVCGRYDWAILRLSSNAWGGGAWASMGYWVPGSSGWFVWNHGYPACGYPHSPANCLANTAYGETMGHSFFNVRGPDQIGENAVFNSANDVSPAHSGGPAFSPNYPDSAGGPYLLGIETNEMCGKCDAAEGPSANDKTYPMMSRRMTNTLAGLITDKKALYP